MPGSDFLNYLNRSPYREALGCLAGEEGLNRFGLLDRLSGRKISAGIAEVDRALEELELGGFIASVNGCYHFQREWFKDFVLFLDEFEESREELDLCEQMLGQGILNAVYRKNRNADF